MVAVLHSHLSAGERHDEWHKIRYGRARIVIGARSAVFAPVENLGLIIVDEEHEHSYKQEEAPRYHARDVAVVRAKMEKCAVVLGTATPSLESYYNATRGKYQLASLTQRVDDCQMPLIRIVDLRQERRKQKVAAILSEQAAHGDDRSARERRANHPLPESARIFDVAALQQLRRSARLSELQRRAHLSSRGCSVELPFLRTHRGRSEKCPACDRTRSSIPDSAPKKWKRTCRQIFPTAVVRRMDADSMTRKDAYRETLRAFRTGKIDMLVGTQMIAKGLHFPNVTLVGIINADLALHLPDFRAGERTFQLLTQVAGRAGRGEQPGEVFVQTYTPFSPSIQFARHHDFAGTSNRNSSFASVAISLRSNTPF